MDSNSNIDIINNNTIDNNNNIDTIKILNTVKYYNNIINDKIIEFNDLYSEYININNNQSHFYYLLNYLHDNIFSLLSNTDIDKIINNNILINGLCDIYINICFLYSREVTMQGFNMLYGISLDNSSYNIYSQRQKRINPNLAIIKKRIMDCKELSLRSKLYDSKNPVAHIALINHDFNYNEKQPLAQREHDIALTVRDLPKLAIND